jgi:hypothetical protein
MPINVPIRFMFFVSRRTAILFAAGALSFCCSCEEHHVGEMPEVQKEHVDVATESEETPGPAGEGSTSPALPAKPTPAEFFPKSTPH